MSAPESFLYQRFRAHEIILTGGMRLAHFEAPLRLVTVVNGSRGRSMGAIRMQAERKKTQRQVGFRAGEVFRRQLLRFAPFHVVRVIRISPRGLDGHDNLGAAMKAVIDGCATALRIKDHDPRVRYVPDQWAGEPHQQLVRLELFAAPFDPVAAARDRHTDDCLLHQVDPGATCICRPPATDEPLVAQLGHALDEVPGTLKSLRKNLRRSITPTPNVVRNRR